MTIENKEITNYIFAEMGNTATGRIYTNQKGAFPVVFSGGNR